MSAVRRRGLRRTVCVKDADIMSEVRGASEAGDKEGRLQRSADELGVFSSNACQHFKAPVELSLSRGTCRQPRASRLNAEEFRRKC